MRKYLAAGTLLSCLVILMPTIAPAGPFADDMAKCMVRSTSEQDRSDLTRWMFAAMSSHPDLAAMSKISAKERDDINAKVGELFSRLMFESCKSEIVQAVQNEGPNTIAYAFQILGQVAARGLFTDPHVTDQMQVLQKYVDQSKLKNLMAAAGQKANP